MKSFIDRINNLTELEELEFYKRVEAISDDGLSDLEARIAMLDDDGAGGF